MAKLRTSRYGVAPSGDPLKQIRVQFSAIGHPVSCDRKYNPAEAAERRITRVVLHAAHLQFIHPRSGDSVSVDCELPPDFQSLLHAFRVANPEALMRAPAMQFAAAEPFL